MSFERCVNWEVWSSVQNRPLWRHWCLRLALCTPSGACHTRRRRSR